MRYRPTSYRNALLLTVLLLVTCASVFAFGTAKKHKPKNDSRHEIERLEGVWRSALISGNASVMSPLLADDYVAISSQGTLQTKEQALANLSSGHSHFDKIEISDRKIRFYGATAIVTSLAEVQGTRADGEISGHFRYTRIYVRDTSGKWKIVSFEASRIRDVEIHHGSEHDMSEK